MNKGSTPIGPGTRVTLEFSIKLNNGELVDSTEGKPATFEVGDGNLLPGFEHALFGLRAGDNSRLSLGPDSAFGQRDEANVRVMDRAEFPQETLLVEGLVFSFAEPQRTELPGVIVKIEDDKVWVDFNHPLSGRDISFDVTIHDVQQVSDHILKSRS